MKKLRVAIIGQGRSGHSIHGTHLVKMPRMFEIVAAVDPLEERRQRAQAEFGCDVYADHKPLLKRNDLDLVVNASPSALHSRIALELWQAGHNVLVEKPLAKTVREVDRMIAAATKAQRLFAIYQQSRFAPYFEQVKKVIASGVLGRITQISITFNGFSRRWDWQTLTACEGGNLLNTGPHPLDQALRFLDMPLDRTPEVFCHMDNTHYFGDAEGHVNLAMRAPDRPFLYLEISSDCAYPGGLYQVYGTQGGMQASMTDAKWKYYVPARAPRHQATTDPIRKADGRPAYCQENLKMIEKTWTIPERKRDLFTWTGNAFYNMLYKHMTADGPLEITPAQVRQQIAVIEICHRQNPSIWGKAGRK
jgi:scyllo-inositol 2-dehydrogenase (NADP+)